MIALFTCAAAFAQESPPAEPAPAPAPAAPAPAPSTEPIHRLRPGLDLASDTLLMPMWSWDEDGRGRPRFDAGFDARVGPALRSWVGPSDHQPFRQWKKQPDAVREHSIALGAMVRWETATGYTNREAWSRTWGGYLAMGGCKKEEGEEARASDAKCGQARLAAGWRTPLDSNGNALPGDKGEDTGQLVLFLGGSEARPGQFHVTPGLWLAVPNEDLPLIIGSSLGFGSDL